MITIYKYNPETGISGIINKYFESWDFNAPDNIWIDIYKSDETENLRILKNVFNFHPLAIEDSLKYLGDKGLHHPKIDDFDKYLFIVFNGIIPEKNSSKYKLFSLSCFIGNNFLITVHNEDADNTISKDLRTALTNSSFKKGPDFILNLILDEIVDRYYPVLEHIESDIDNVEQSIFKESPSNRLLLKILNIKKELIKLRRITSYQKEVLYKLSRGDSEIISLEESIYYRNVYDHLVRVSDTVESYRDYSAGLLDSYLSTVNNKMNEIMKFLTIIATIMLPLTLITGIFGMNFDVIPFLHNEIGFYLSLGLMTAVAVIMIIFFRIRKWI
ncbi:MAG: Cobalt/magnesium transport protein CorA [Ignavibacteria bacterium]|nr:Cobalt/magnesium transport protein CorA [Ignavibacteria bacterium]